jgi:hypothetical protein
MLISWIRNTFINLNVSRAWVHDELPSCIALVYIFMPLIRFSMETFVQQWNAHHIRKQNNRRHVVSGKPWVLFEMPDPSSAVDCRVQLDQPTCKRLRDILDLDPYDMDEYLPASMMELCSTLLEGFVQTEENVQDRPCFHQYWYLKDQLERHENKKAQPILSVRRHPTGGAALLKRKLSEQGVDLDDFFHY